jgi:hypothetical protein
MPFEDTASKKSSKSKFVFEHPTTNSKLILQLSKNTNFLFIFLQLANVKNTQVKMVLNLKLLVCLSLLLLRVYQRESLRVSFLFENLSTKTDCVFFILIAVSQRQEHSSENGSEPETSRVLKAAASKSVSKSKYLFNSAIYKY